MDRKRCSNFTGEEEQILVTLIKKYSNVIENKKSGATTWKDKEKMWRKIEEEFNRKELGGDFKDYKTLKIKYANLKKRTKQKCSENKQNILKTGGGTCNMIKLTSQELTIKEMIGQQIDGLSNIFDSDNTVQDENGNMQKTEIATEEPSEPEIVFEEIVESNDASELLNDWSDYSPSKLKKPVSEKLTPLAAKRKSNTRMNKVYTRKDAATKKYTSIQHELIEEKLEFVRLQKDKFMEEHTLRIQLLKIKLELKNKQLFMLQQEPC